MINNDRICIYFLNNILINSIKAFKMNYISPLANNLIGTISNVVRSGLQQTSQWMGRAIQVVKLIPQQMKNHPYVAIAMITATNALFFLVIRSAINRMNQRRDENQKPLDIKQKDIIKQPGTSSQEISSQDVNKSQSVEKETNGIGQEGTSSQETSPDVNKNQPVEKETDGIRQEGTSSQETPSEDVLKDQPVEKEVNDREEEEPNSQEAPLQNGEKDQPFEKEHNPPDTLSQPSHLTAIVTTQDQDGGNVGQQVPTSGSKENVSQSSEKNPVTTLKVEEPSSKPSDPIPTIPEALPPISLEEFNKKLKRFSNFTDDYKSKDAQQVSEELFKNIPENLEIKDIGNFIFNNCSKYDIPLLLSALLIVYPSSLSPYDQIRKAILEDEQHVLTNSSLMDLFKSHQLEPSEENLRGCYDLAYEANHPYIYRPSQQVVTTADYSLNFLWVNLNPQDRVQDTAQNIFKDGLDLSENADCIKDPKALRQLEANEQSLEGEELKNWKKVKGSFAYRISKWADANPNAEMNFWYDSALVTQRAQQKTFEMMKGISESRGVNLKLRDIRQLPTINRPIVDADHNIEKPIGEVLHPSVPVYYRVDLLKVLIADYMMGSPKENAKYCVVSDIDIEPMTLQQLFDQRTLDYLSTNGYVFNRVGYSNFENNFFIFNKEIDEVQLTHHETMIREAAYKFNQIRQYPINTNFRHEFVLGSQSIYNLYFGFQKKVKEIWNAPPRKVVKCPRSQFNGGGNFSNSDHQSETFRFIGEDPVPYVQKGRNPHWGEAQIEELRNWKPEPLQPVESSQA